MIDRGLNIDPAQLKPYGNNARTHSDKQVEQIMASMDEFTFTNAILVDEDNTVLAGHGRLMAANRLNMASVPVDRIHGLTAAQKKAYVLADNKMALNAGWDEKLLAAEFGELTEMGFDLALTGFSPGEIKGLDAHICPTVGLTEEDEIPPEPSIPASILGDIWLLGNHRVCCGDSTDSGAVAILTDAQPCDMVFTDPPYGISYGGGRDSQKHGMIKNDDLQGDDLGNLICNVFDFNKPHADVYICVLPKLQKPFLDFIESAGKVIDSVIVWDKKQPGLGYMAYRRQCEFILFVKGGSFKKGDPSDFDLWSISRDSGKDYVHGTQKPVAVPERAILNSSKAGDIVLDYFLGSGSTLIACEKQGRRCYGMELDPKYVDIIVKRWEDFTGQKAIHENGKSFETLKQERGV